MNDGFFGNMSDLIVIGGGIIGMLTARELAVAGRRVTLLERGRTGEESSWAGGGILSPLYPWRYAAPITRLARWSQQHYAALAGQLLRETGVDPEYTASGLLMLGLEAEELGQGQAWAAQNGYHIEQIGAAALSGIQPGLGAFAGDALWMPDIAQVRNPRFVRALRRSIDLLGVRVLEHRPVDKLMVRSGEIVGARSGSSEYTAPQVVVCGGAWSEQLAESAGCSVGVYPVKGQMLLYRAEPGLLRRIVLADDRYAIPRRDGHILLGSTMEDAGFDKTTTGEAREALQAAAERMLPALARYPLVKQWAGLRPGRARGIPCISAHPQIGGLFVNAGHFRNGVVTGLASARLMADLILGREPILEPAEFAL
jgi:glycine oxidase